MEKETIDCFAYLPQVMKLLAQPGALLTSINRDGNSNVMTIGWCQFGILWGKAVCLVYVRPSRHTFTCLQEVHQFTVNFPSPSLVHAVSLCGSHSGRDANKFQLAGLTPIPAQAVKPPIIEQCILHYECNILHHNDLLPENMDPGVIGSYFPRQDFHRIYFGEIVCCYGNPERLAEI